MALHLTKVAFGATSLETMQGWFRERGELAFLTTRNLPRRADEIAGQGSLFWILKHQLVARSPILRFEPADGGRQNIVISTRLIVVHPQPRRAHQGWRYLEDADAPRDLAAGEEAGDVMPGALASDLARLGLM